MKFLTQRWPFGALAALFSAQLYAAPALGSGDVPNVSDGFHGWLLGIVATLAVGAVAVAGRSIILLYKLEVRIEHHEAERKRAERLQEKRDAAVDAKFETLEADCKRRKDHLWNHVTPVAGNRSAGD